MGTDGSGSLSRRKTWSARLQGVCQELSRAPRVGNPARAFDILPVSFQPVPMRYRRFGRTNLQIPVFSCGGMRYQQSWSDISWSEVKPEGQANLEATIHRAVELGL